MKLSAITQRAAKSAGMAIAMMIVLAPTASLGQTIDADLYFEKASKARTAYPDSARFYTEVIFGAFETAEPDASELMTLIKSANLRRYMNDFARAREVLGKLEPYVGQPGNEAQLAYYHQALGIIDNQQGRYPSASDHFFRSMKLHEALGDSANIAVILRELGIVHERLNLHEAALEFGVEALKLVRAIGDSAQIATFLGDVGTMHQNIGKLDEALRLQLESLRYYKLLGLETYIPYSHHNIGDIYLKKEMIDSAEVYTTLALEGFEQFDLPFAALYALMNLGSIHQKRSSFALAEEYFLRAYDRASQFEGLYEQAMVLEKLSALHEQMGRHDSALKYLKESFAIRDSLSVAERDTLILGMSQTLKNNLARLEIEKLRDSEAISETLIATQRVFLIVVSIGLLAISVAFVLTARANKRSLKLNRELVESNIMLTNMSNERSNLVYVMAHDVRSPFVQIALLTELITESDEMSDAQREFVKLIEVASRNGLSTIAQMVESVEAQREAKSTTIHADVDMLGLIDESLRLFEAHATSKNIKIMFDNEVVAPVVKGNPVALRRVIDNLVSNALKYTYPGTTVHVTMREDANHLQVYIKDEGPGFSDDDKLLLFRKFTKLSARPTGNESSTGLGLSIVHDLLDQIGGTIHLVEDGRSGACFCVELPKG